MNDNSSALIDLRTVDIYELARRANLPVRTGQAVPPPHERIELGEIKPLAGFEHSALGKAILYKVELYNNARGERDPYAYSFEKYLHAVATTKRRREQMGDEFDTRYNLTRDFKGYVSYLCSLHDELERVINSLINRPSSIEETRDRRAHTLITGSSRSGKSELLKLLVHHYVKHPELGGVLLVDPHGDLVRQVARWREFAGNGSDRLVYLDAGEGDALGGASPALNPLVRGSATQDELPTLAGHLADALAYFGGEGEGQTPQMQRLAAFCLQVLLEMEGSTLFDLMSGLTVPPRREKIAEPAFVQRGKAHADEVVRDFFLNDWNGESYRTTRDALKRRLSTHLRAPKFRRMMTAPNPIDLEALLNAGKVVLVNCSLEGEAGNALGRFLVARVAAIGRRRLDDGRIERKPVHVFVDEATQLMAPPFVNILERFAKSKIWLTMAQQGAGEGGERDFINRVKRSTLLKFIGRSGAVGEMLRLVDMERRELPILEQGQFIVTKTGEEKMPHLLRVLWPSPLADGGNAMSEREFAAVMAKQVAAYYRREGERPKALPSPAPQAQGKRTWIRE